MNHSFKTIAILSAFGPLIPFQVFAMAEESAVLEMQNSGAIPLSSDELAALPPPPSQPDREPSILSQIFGFSAPSGKSLINSIGALIDFPSASAARKTPEQKQREQSLFDRFRGLFNSDSSD